MAELADARSLCPGRIHNRSRHLVAGGSGGSFWHPTGRRGGCAAAVWPVVEPAAAIYTAYLFSQAEGRDLWQSSLLPTHLLIQSFMVGSGLLLVLALFLPNPPGGLVNVTRTIFIVALILDLFVTLIGEFSIPHASEVAAKAAHEISHGHYRKHFWWGSIALGHVAPLVLVLAATLLTAQPFIGAVAGLCAIAGLYFFEYAFVMAPQELPNS